MILVLTQFPHVVPPYALETVLSLFLEFLKSEFFICLIPLSLHLQSEQIGPLDFLSRTLETSLPPGVLIGMERRDLVA